MHVEHTDIDFHGEAIKVRHVTTRERLALLDKYSEDLTGRDVVNFQIEITAMATEFDDDELLDWSMTRMQELAGKVLEINQMGQSAADDAAKNSSDNQSG